MRSLRDLEGYFCLDHRNSPGISDELAVAAGLLPGAGKGIFESATFTCSHCNAVVVLNPNRQRERGYCKKCDHYVCDACETERVRTGVCYPMRERAYDAIDLALKLGK